MRLALLVFLGALTFAPPALGGFPHHDRLGYHHCPERAKLGPGDCHQDAAIPSGQMAEGNVIREGITDDEQGRRHHPRDAADRESFRLVDDFFHWQHGRDVHSRKARLHRRRADECRHLHELYIFRHGLRGPERNTCSGWRRDAHWHERHPAELSTFLGIGV